MLAIQHARQRRKAFLGTCGGFQHALVEYAQNVLGHDAAHQETEPSAPEPLIVKLSCSLLGAKAKVIAVSHESFGAILGGIESIEEFNCNYGVNVAHQSIFEGSDLVFVAHDEAGQIRAFRVLDHPFFVGTLFQPERRALADGLHPIVRSFFQSA
jgi:CTP synthase (UTP-ammonia lyase)